MYLLKSFFKIRDWVDVLFIYSIILTFVCLIDVLILKDEISFWIYIGTSLFTLITMTVSKVDKTIDDDLIELLEEFMEDDEEEVK